MTAITCPSGDSIRQFVLGELAEELAESVARHLGQCASCALTLDGLKIDDTLLATLRRASAGAVDATPAPEIERLIERFRKLPAGSLEETLAPQQSVGDPADFLAPAQAADEVGRLGNYRVLKVLGVGGMGVVLLAEDTKLGRRVAVKVMTPALASSAKARDRFFREARHAAKLKHDNVVTIYQVDEERGMPFLAMELLEGEPLDERLKRDGPLPAAEVLRIGREIAQGLAAAHKRDLLHRDIKPANIWLEADTGRVKILDFGLARAVREETQLTQQGVIVGTPAYMAPEQGRGGEVDHRADLFSLGCVLYRMATGKPPFRGKDIVATLLSVATDVPPPPASLNPAVSHELSDFIMKLLEKKPEDRPASAAAVVLTLAAMEATPSVRATSVWRDIEAEETAPPPPKPRRARKVQENRKPAPKWKLPAIVAGLLLLALGGALAGYQLIFKSENGTLIVEVDDNVELMFKSGKLHVRAGDGNEYTLEPNPQNKTLPPGQYSIKVTGVDGLKVNTPEFVLEKGDKRKVYVIADPNWRPVAANTADPNRRIAEWVLKVGELRVGVFPNQVRVTKSADLPAGPIVLDEIILNGEIHKMSAADLRNLDGITRLRSLTLFQMGDTDADLQWLAEQPGLATNLEGLFLAYTKVTNVGMRHLQKFNKLQFIHVGTGAVGDAGLKVLVALPHVRHLNLAGTSVTGAGLASLRGSQVTYLNFNSCGTVGDDGLMHIAAIPTLIALELSHTSISDAGLVQLRGLGQLRNLNLAKTKITADVVKKLAAALPQCKIVSDHGTFEPQSDPDRRVAEWAKKHGGAVTLFLGGKSVVVPADAPLPEGTFAVERIDLPMTARISDAELAPLANLTRLHTLVLTGTPVGDAAAGHLAAAVSLTDLHFTETKIGDEGVRRLKELRRLRLLTLSGTSVTDLGVAALGGYAALEDLNLHNTKVGDAALAGLAKCPALKTLHLSSTRVTDVGLPRLAAVKTLRHLTLTKTKVTATAVKQLARALPDCTIESDHGTIGPKK